MNTVSRHSLSKNFNLTSLIDENGKIIKKTIKYDEFIILIDRAKHYLIKEKNAKHGQVALMACVFWPDYLVWWFACAELGITLTTSEFPKPVNLMNDPYIIGRDVDHWIFDYQPMIDHLLSGTGASVWKDKIIVSECALYQHQISSDFDSPFWGEEDDILIRCLTSGSTGEPKAATHTQKYIMEIARRNLNIYNMSESTRYFHNRGLHHGGLAVCMLMPALIGCQNHYHAPYRYTAGTDDWMESEMVNAWVTMIQEEKINMTHFTPQVVDEFFKNIDVNKGLSENFVMFFSFKLKEESVKFLIENFKIKMVNLNLVYLLAAATVAAA